MGVVIKRVIIIRSFRAGEVFSVSLIKLRVFANSWLEPGELQPGLVILASKMLCGYCATSGFE